MAASSFNRSRQSRRAFSAFGGNITCRVSPKPGPAVFPGYLFPAGMSMRPSPNGNKHSRHEIDRHAAELLQLILDTSASNSKLHASMRNIRLYTESKSAATCPASKSPMGLEFAPYPRTEVADGFRIAGRAGEKAGASRSGIQELLQNRHKCAEVRVFAIALRAFALFGDLPDCFERRCTIYDRDQVGKVHEILGHLLRPGANEKLFLIDIAKSGLDQCIQLSDGSKLDFPGIVALERK